ncbi:S8 family serine peptidase, partial [Intestinibacillus massiliensis]|nr:S8 family serine peptidase [Intestinibacillus massiliensis]
MVVTVTATALLAFWDLNWEDDLLKDAVDEVTAKGTTVVCAAGNDNNQVPNYPADFDSCISVISTNQSNQKSNFSNYGAAKDLSAPGGETQLYSNGQEKLREGILSSYPGGYAWSAGTSMASPVVAGVASMLY